jgi:hypothetical protein
MPKKRWSDLSQRTRTTIVLLAAFEGILKIMALMDLKRRPANEIRGSKVKWATAIVLVNSIGAVPLAYFFRGRRTGRNGT